VTKDADDLLPEVYGQYRKALNSISWDSAFAEYNWGNLPPTLGMSWLPYGQMFSEFSREIANAINQFVNYVHCLKAWAIAIEPLNTKQKLEVVIEFVEPIATLALNFPYAIRSRFIFAVAQLAHQANRAIEGAAWKDDLRLDDKINFQDSDLHAGRWPAYQNLKQCLETISASDYRDATAHFRNEYNHRFPTGIVVGITGLVTRHVDEKTKSVSYGFGGIAPLAIDDMIPPLSAQRDRCLKAFDAFKLLIREQEASIRASIPS
jgi:hypothetical protein